MNTESGLGKLANIQECDMHVMNTHNIYPFVGNTIFLDYVDHSLHHNFVVVIVVHAVIQLYSVLANK